MTEVSAYDHLPVGWLRFMQTGYMLGLLHGLQGVYDKGLVNPTHILVRDFRFHSDNSRRINNVLQRDGIITFADLEARTETSLLALRNFEEDDLPKVVAALAHFGLALAEVS